MNKLTNTLTNLIRQESKKRYIVYGATVLLGATSLTVIVISTLLIINAAQVNIPGCNVLADKMGCLGEGCFGGGLIFVAGIAITLEGRVIYAVWKNKELENVPPIANTEEKYTFGEWRAKHSDKKDFISYLLNLSSEED